MDWKAIVSSVAPTIATALGGPLAGMATKIVSEKLLGKPDATSEELFAAISDPEALAKLKQADHEFKTKMAEIGIDLEKIAAGDRDSARQREIALEDTTPKVLAGVIVVGFFVTLGCVAFVAIPASAQPPVNILLGALTAMITQVGNYYFGSSSGSSKKNAMLAGLVKN